MSRRRPPCPPPAAAPAARPSAPASTPTVYSLPPRSAPGTKVCLVGLGMLHRWAAAAPGPWHATLRLDLPTTGAESLLAQFSLAYLLADTLYM